MTRFSTQTPRMDDIMELRERLAHCEPLVHQVSSIRSAFDEGKETSSVVKQLVKSLEDRAAKLEEGLQTIGTTVNINMQQDVSKQGREITAVESDLQRVHTVINSMKETAQHQNTASIEKWDSYKKNIEDKFVMQHDNHKASLQHVNRYIICIISNQC